MWFGSSTNSTSSSSSNENAASASSSSWFGGLREMTGQLVQVCKHDLAEFVTVVKQDTAEVVTSAVKTSDPTRPSLTERISKMGQNIVKSTSGVFAMISESKDASSSSLTGSSFSRSETRLLALQRDPNLFLHDPSEESYLKWCDEWNAIDHTQDISELLTHNSTLQELHSQFVPDKTTYKDFWSRYFFAVSKIHREEQLRAEVIRSVNQDSAEDDFNWEDEDDPKTEENSNNSTFPAAEEKAAEAHSQVEVERREEIDQTVDEEPEHPNKQSSSSVSDSRQPEWVVLEQKDSQALSSSESSLSSAVEVQNGESQDEQKEVSGKGTSRSAIADNDDWGDWE